MVAGSTGTVERAGGLVGHWWATLTTNGSGEGKEGYGAQVLVGAREADGLVAHMW